MVGEVREGGCVCLGVPAGLTGWVPHGEMEGAAEYCSNPPGRRTCEPDPGRVWVTTAKAPSRAVSRGHRPGQGSPPADSASRASGGPERSCSPHGWRGHCMHSPGQRQPRPHPHRAG